MTRVISGFFDDDEVARNAVRELEKAGIPASQIALVGNNADDHWSSTLLPRYGDAAMRRAAAARFGGVVGGGARLLARMGMMTIPGLGAVVAAGWLASTAARVAAGALAGGFLGLLVGAGITAKHAHIYAEGIRRGGTLVVVRTVDAREPAARVALMRNGAVDPDARGAQYRETGWSGFDDTAPPLSTTGRVRYTDAMHWLR